MTKTYLSLRSDAFTIHPAPAFTFTHDGEKHAIYIRSDDPAFGRVSELVGDGDADVDQIAFSELNLLTDVRPASEPGPLARIGFR